MFFNQSSIKIRFTELFEGISMCRSIFFNMRLPFQAVLLDYTYCDSNTTIQKSKESSSYVFFVTWKLTYLKIVFTSQFFSPFSSGIGFVQTQRSILNPPTLGDSELLRYERVRTTRNITIASKIIPNKLVVSENTS